MTEREKREKAIAKMIKDSDFDGTFEFVTEEQFADIVRKGGYRDFARVYDAGYRKVDKDSVFHIDISEELTTDFFKNEIAKVRKETATKFYNELKNEVETEYDKRILNVVAKEFGVEVEE